MTTDVAADVVCSAPYLACCGTRCIVVSAFWGLGWSPFQYLVNRWASPGHRLLNESTGQLLALSGW